mmetsp:Transcript_14358/g.48641  ORF Transcript_14358/g.48641 Transcript_14358/m.48641 type:complete len:641 (-) Transcript_14358:29-1951(-)
MARRPRPAAPPGGGGQSDSESGRPAQRCRGAPCAAPRESAYQSCGAGLMRGGAPTCSMRVRGQWPPGVHPTAARNARARALCGAEAHPRHLGALHVRPIHLLVLAGGRRGRLHVVGLRRRVVVLRLRLEVVLLGRHGDHGRLRGVRGLGRRRLGAASELRARARVGLLPEGALHGLGLLRGHGGRDPCAHDRRVGHERGAPGLFWRERERTQKGAAQGQLEGKEAQAARAEARGAPHGAEARVHHLLQGEGPHGHRGVAAEQGDVLWLGALEGQRVHRLDAHANAHQGHREDAVQQVPGEAPEGVAPHGVVVTHEGVHPEVAVGEGREEHEARRKARGRGEVIRKADVAAVEHVLVLEAPRALGEHEGEDALPEDDHHELREAVHGELHVHGHALGPRAAPAHRAEDQRRVRKERLQRPGAEEPQEYGLGRGQEQAHDEAHGLQHEELEAPQRRAQRVAIAINGLAPRVHGHELHAAEHVHEAAHDTEANHVAQLPVLQGLQVGRHVVRRRRGRDALDHVSEAVHDRARLKARAVREEVGPVGQEGDAQGNEAEHAVVRAHVVLEEVPEAEGGRHEHEVGGEEVERLRVPRRLEGAPAEERPGGHVDALRVVLGELPPRRQLGDEPVVLAHRLPTAGRFG